MSSKEAIDARRRGGAPKAGSVWESRMKTDEVKGGIKVFNATHDSSLENTQDTCGTTNSTTITTTVSRTEDHIHMDKKITKQSPSGVSGKRKTWKSEGSPVKIASQRSELNKNLDEQFQELSEGIKKSNPISIKKTRSVGDGNQKNAIQLKKVKSDSAEVINDSKSEVNSVKSTSVKKIKNCDDKKVVDESNKDVEKSPIGDQKSRSDEDCKEFGVCEEKAITSNVTQIKNPSNDVEEEEDKEIEVENKSLDIKEITIQDHNPKKIVIHNEKSVPISPVVKKQPPPSPVVNHATFHPSPPKNTTPISDNFHESPRTNSKLQSFVDLVMWKDVSKSAFVFGIGTFAIISSSYTKDLNISFISIVSYLGLVYLAAIFFFRSLINRGSMEMENQDYVVGEEETIWVMKLVLPYINEFLLQLRALFSGDPATTMKLAVLLFILARCGSSITILKIAKLGFIGVFTVPKVCSTYSSHLAAYGTFWIHRFEDAWESCSHKKALGFAIFTLVWNLSSVVARIWAVFMLFVAFKYYQQSLIKEEWAQEEEEAVATNSEKSIGGQSCKSTLAERRKLKKVY